MKLIHSKPDIHILNARSKNSNSSLEKESKKSIMMQIRNKIRVSKPSIKIKIGDVITLTKFENIFVISVKNFAKNRLSAKEAMGLYKKIKIISKISFYISKIVTI